MEEAFRLDRHMGDVPWQLSWQKNERSLTFDDSLKVQMIKGFAAKELGLSAEVSSHCCRGSGTCTAWHAACLLTAVRAVATWKLGASCWVSTFKLAPCRSWMRG